MPRSLNGFAYYRGARNSSTAATRRGSTRPETSVVRIPTERNSSSRSSVQPRQRSELPPSYEEVVPPPSYASLMEPPPTYEMSTALNVSSSSSTPWTQRDGA